MKKLYILALILTSMMLGCKKDNKTSGGNTSTVDPNKVEDIYITIDGVTNYRYMYPEYPTFSLYCSSTLLGWSNVYSQLPENGAGIIITDAGMSTSITVTHIKNNFTTQYAANYNGKRIIDISTSTIVNNKTQIEFNNLKIYKQEDYVKNDTTKPFYVSGKITCK